MSWVRLDCDEYINLETTLFSGQIFHFKRLGNSLYGGVIGGLLAILMQRDRDVFYLDNDPGMAKTVRRFLNTDVLVSVKNPVPGLRFLTNDFYSTIFSFICSSNNNVKRITRMVDYLYSKGQQIAFPLFENDTVAHGCPNVSEVPQFYHLPSLESLMNIEDDLRANKFGYRAKYICDAARFLYGNQLNWEKLESSEVRGQLMKIKGIGRKVADCICLISLKRFDVVPIDTHILKHSISIFGLPTRTLTSRTYDKIQENWRARYGEYAGIVQLHVFKRYLDGRVMDLKDEQ
ncbi:N-glycosylase/DNA lyase [Pancytospora epiphaga]|nr:N-glycosylase/DNA lyase [Pancytospora epiphaga]